jgi:hypothetical protein
LFDKNTWLNNKCISLGGFPVNLYRCGVVSEKKKDIDEKPEYKTGMIYNSKIVII